MNWNGEAYEYAEARSSEYFGYLPEQMFENGAKWQRDQLRTNEAIERVAVIEFAREYGDGRGATLWADVREEVREYYRDEARNYISALLGDN